VGLAYLLEGADPSAAFIADLRKRRDAMFHTDAFPNVAAAERKWDMHADGYPNAAAVQQKWAEVEKEQAEFVNGVTNECLEKMLPFRTTQASLAHLMQHLANHSTYHRGQIALMMRQLGAKPVATDFHVFLVEGRREAAAAQ